MLQSLSLLVHADSKVGKTTLAATSPPPILIMDAEGGTKFLPLSNTLAAMYGRPVNLVEWDGMHQPPRYDGSWDICIVPIHNWQIVEMVYQWLLSGQHDFQSLVVDSITEIQRRCKANLTGSDAMKIQDWGTLLTQMDSIIRGLRDLANHPTRPFRVVVFIAETRQNRDGKWKPYMQGQIEVALPYWMDCVGYLYTAQAVDENGQMNGHEVRQLLIKQHPQFEAGERLQGRLGQLITEPNITTMYQQLFGQVA